MINRIEARWIMTIVEFPDFESHARDTGIILKGKTLTCNHPSSTIILISTPPHSKSFCDSDTKKPYKWYKRWKTNTIYPSSSLLRTNIPYKISLVFVCRELANNSLLTYLCLWTSQEHCTRIANKKPLIIAILIRKAVKLFIILSSLLRPYCIDPAPHIL